MEISWPEFPSDDDFSIALRKGFGRVYLWASGGTANSDCLLAACLHDYRYDRQVEDARGDWLWHILTAASLREEFKSEVLDSLNSVEKSGAAAQLCQLARHYAMAGDERFRSELRRIIEDKPVQDAEWLGEEELIRLEGGDGFLRAVRRHGTDLLSREWEWYDGALGDVGIERLGEGVVMDILSSDATSDPSTRRFTEAWLQDRQRSAEIKQMPRQKQVEGYSTDEIITAAESVDKTSVRFRSWGRTASDSDVNVIYRRMLATTEVEALRRYIQVFARRPWPEFDARLLQLCVHDDENICRRATTAVAQNRHPEVRRFALEHLANPRYQEHSIEMLVRNYEAHDEDIVLKCLQLPEDDWQLHGVLMSVRKLIEENETAECEAAVRIVYEDTPCSECRRAMVKLLAERVGLPDSMRSECRYDVDVDTRSLAGGPAWID